jgi:methionyl-tRNA formyltransferase
MTRIVFFGTPDEATPTLQALNDGLGVGLVVTRPDRPKGRSGSPAPPPVKVLAQDLGLALAQPQDRGEVERAVGEAGRFDVGVVVAYGRILTPAVLEVPTHGILNIHFSLLPRWRGAAPVPRALMAGDTMTGVTIIRIDEGLDTGPVLTAQAVDILSDENAGELTARLASMGARLLTEVLPRYLSGELEPVDQLDDGVTYATPLGPADRALGQDRDPATFLGRVRGLAPSPGATLEIDGTTHKILEAHVLEVEAPPVGRWVAGNGAPLIGVGGTAIALDTLQSAGRRLVSGADWVRGRHRTEGVVG